MMSPRIEFIAVTSLLASLLATLGYVCAFGGKSDSSQHEFEMALAAAVAGALAGGVAAVLSSAWHASANRANTTWSPERFSLYTTVPVLVIFPFLLGLGAGVVDLLLFPTATPLSDASYVMMIFVFLGLFASAAGAVPFLILEFLVCHRFQLRTTVTTGSA